MTTEYKSILRGAPISPQKARLVADMIRGKAVSDSINLLTYSNKKASGLLKKILLSSVANAENRAAVDIDALFVSKAFVDEGVFMKRTMPRAKGRADRFLKRTSHITICVSEKN